MLVSILYGLAFNAYVQPTNGDDITYFHGALSIVSGDGFTEQGKWIVDWPPVHSSIVAVAMLLTGIRDFYLVKIINSVALLAAVLLAYRVMVREYRTLPLLSCILIAIFPTSLVVGTAGQADFCYFAFSMLFLLLLEKLRSLRHVWVALLCGLSLGVTSLTRWQGTLLGVCLIFQACSIGFRTKPWKFGPFFKSIWLEVIASVIGASLFVAWKIWLHICVQRGLGGFSNYQYLGRSIWSVPDPLETFSAHLNLLTQVENLVLTLCPTLLLPLKIVVILFVAVCIWGFILRISERGWFASDAFVLCTLWMLSMYAYKESRYGIPLAPFLLDYLFRGLYAFHLQIASLLKTSERMQQSQRVGFFAIWIVGLFAFDGLLIFYGDGESMGPACQFLLENNRDYLRGYHRDLYDVCKQLQAQNPTAIIATDKFHKQLIRHYSGLEAHFVEFAPNANYKLFIQVDPLCLTKRANDLARHELDFPPSLMGRISNPRPTGYVTLWDVDATDEHNSNQSDERVRQ